jgi:hypothetical protein
MLWRTYSGHKAHTAHYAAGWAGHIVGLNVWPRENLTNEGREMVPIGFKTQSLRVTLLHANKRKQICDIIKNCIKNIAQLV